MNAKVLKGFQDRVNVHITKIIIDISKLEQNQFILPRLFVTYYAFRQMNCALG